MFDLNETKLARLTTPCPDNEFGVLSPLNLPVSSSSCVSFADLISSADAIITARTRSEVGKNLFSNISDPVG